MASAFDERVNTTLGDLDRNPELSFRALENHHTVSSRTLKRRLAGGQSRAIARESQQLLSIEQERLLANWILVLETEGHAPTHKTVREMAAQISKNSGGRTEVGNDWTKRFMRRHPEVYTKIGQKIDALRVQNTLPDILSAWFSRVKRVLTEYKVDPENVWNMDETGIALGVCTNQRVMGSSATSRIYKKTPENKEWVSIVETISAGGRSTRCLVIFKGKNLQSTWFKHTQVPDWQYTCLENGWTSNNIAVEWLEKIFIPETKPRVPGATRILLLDNHGSHITTEFMWKCF